MKKTYIQWNKEVDDSKLFVDLYELSNRKIDKRNSDIKLSDMKELNQRKPPRNNGQKKK